MLRSLLVTVLLSCLACAVTPKAAAPAPQTPTVVLLVRHAEKEPGDDPPLTPAGEARARALVEVAGRAGVSAVYSTPTRRTRATAAPLAAQLGLTVREREAGPKQVPAFAAALREEARGRTVLVVGHSNTVPQLVEALTGVRVAPVADAEYDRLYVLTLPAAGTPGLLEVRYGAPSGK